jgi:aryl-alcohol dehydrogenase-like predicted oxidoreductase
VWAMSDLIASGKALYWGTSEWSADEIRAACDIAERHHLRKPVVEQTQYNLVSRQRIEKEYARVFEDLGIGVTSFSPLASGLLTGKYLDGRLPEGSRATLPGYEWLQSGVLGPERTEKARALKAIADDLGCPMSQLAIAWCLRNRNISTVILGASSAQQLRSNLAALDVVPLLDEEVAERLDAIAPPN